MARSTGTASSDLAGALAAAGISDLDGGIRRRAEYSSDASNYRVVPTVVVYPRHLDEVAGVLAVARERSESVTARGGGTSIAGNSIGTGIVLDFSRHLRRIHLVDPESRTAVVEPGVILDSISKAAAPYGLRFGPDPSTHSRATIGGSIGNNSCGSRTLRYGRTAENVVELTVMTADGTALRAGRFGRDGLGGAGPVGTELDRLVADRLGVIRTEFGRFRRQISGYSLEHLLPENGCDLGRFLAGTEGSLGILLKATVRLVQPPAAVALAVLGYSDMPSAADAVPALLPHRPVAIEGMDARLVAKVRAKRGTSAVPDLPRGDGWLFVETAGQTEAEARGAAAELIADSGCIDSAILTGAPAKLLWAIREDGSGLGGRTPAGQPAWPGWEDAAVPPAELGRYLREFFELMREHRLDSLVYGHFGDGCVHARIDFPLTSAPERYRAFVQQAAELVVRHGGSLSGEHGDGRARGELLPMMYSAAAIDTFAAVKRIFDPGNLLNPGMIVDPLPLDADLRVPAARLLRTNLAFAYPEDGGDLGAAVHRCTGVGKCRADNTSDGGVMCPSYLATRDERDSTRGRARVLQEAANGTLVKGIASVQVLDALDLCLSCKGCAADCPTGVDMASYKAEVLHHRYRRRVRPIAHYSMGWLPRWAAIAGRAPRMVNAILQNPRSATVIKRLGGLDRRRPLPEFAVSTFRRQFTPTTGGTGSPVLLWVDTFTDHFNPEIGLAAVRVLERAGYRVQITDRAVCCGLTWISTGQLDAARRQLRATVVALTEAVDKGIPIVGLEPSCTAVLRSDLVALLPKDPRAQAVSRLTMTLAELLTSAPGFRPPDLSGVDAVVQVHCHQHAVMGWSADAVLLTEARARVTQIGGCCGLAGNFGVERGHYDVSIAVAETALLPALRNAQSGSVVLADGFSCRTQIEQLSTRRGIHLAELLDERRDSSSSPTDG